MSLIGRWTYSVVWNWLCWSFLWIDFYKALGSVSNINSLSYCCITFIWPPGTLKENPIILTWPSAQTRQLGHCPGKDSRKRSLWVWWHLLFPWLKGRANICRAYFICWPLSVWGRYDHLCLTDEKTETLSQMYLPRSHNYVSGRVRIGTQFPLKPTH